MQIFLKEEDIKREDLGNKEKDLKNKNIKFEIRNKETYHHLVNVLRVNVGDNISIVNKNKKYETKIIEIDKEKIVVYVLESGKEEAQNTKIEFSIYQGIPKAKKAELIIEKLTEIGIDNIYLLEMERSIVRKKDYNKSKMERLIKKAESASMQSRRISIPKVHEVLTFDEYIYNTKEIENKNNLENTLNILFILYEENNERFFKEEIKKAKECIRNKIKDKEKKEGKETKVNISFLVGPEGGISEKEIEKVKEVNRENDKTNTEIYICGLGKNILRTETAAITAMSILKYEFEDFEI